MFLASIEIVHIIQNGRGGRGKGNTSYLKKLVA